MAAAINRDLDLLQLFVGDDEEVAGAACRIRNANPCDALPEISEFSGIVPKLSQVASGGH